LYLSTPSSQAGQKAFKPWDGHTPDEKTVFARLMENYADFAEHDVGRIVDALEELGVSENTVFLYQLGDNGMSAMETNGDGVARTLL
jgi:arylsulfatase A-like enzyme